MFVPRSSETQNSLPRQWVSGLGDLERSQNAPGDIGLPEGIIKPLHTLQPIARSHNSSTSKEGLH
jgi:hypothetical protein